MVAPFRPRGCGNRASRLVASGRNARGLGLKLTVLLLLAALFVFALLIGVARGLA